VRETIFDVENVPAKLTLLHNLFLTGQARMYDGDPGCYDEFGSLSVIRFGENQKGSKYVKTGYAQTFPNQNTYFYSNLDGSFYVNNPDGSEFFHC